MCCLHLFCMRFADQSEDGRLFTVRNEVAKVMFLQASVCPQGGRGVGVSASVDAGIPHPLGADTPPRADTPQGADTPQEQTPPRADTPPEQTPSQEQTPPPREQTPPGADTPPPRYDHCCGRYASYWNASLS